MIANKSPPIPFETGSIKPSVAFAAMAASTALPPFFKMSSPACVAAGTLVHTIPCRASTSERVAKLLPVIRSICADARSTMSKRATTNRIAFIRERLLRLSNSDSRNRKHSASNQILHASPRSDSNSVHMFCRSGERCGRANFWSGAQENLFHAHAHAAPKKEKRHCDKKEITDANTNSVAEEKEIANAVADF